MHYDRRVEVVLVNYKRPSNIPKLIQAFRNQSVQCHITLINAAPSDDFVLGNETLRAVDQVLSWRHEFGPYNRYVPLAVYSHEFTYFHDDDMLPGNRLIEHFIGSADEIADFGVLGQLGRNVTSDGEYVPRAIARTAFAVPVDVIVRGYFVRTKNLPAVIELRHVLGLLPDVSLEDDLLLCTAMSMVRGLRNFVTPIDSDEETLMNKAPLRGDFARFKRAEHFNDRTNFCKKAIQAGWVPLSQQAESVDVIPSQIAGSASNERLQGATQEMSNLTNIQITSPSPGLKDYADLGASPVSADSSANPTRKFDVNGYWLKRGKTYIQEERLYTTPYRLQEEFILGGLLGSEIQAQEILEIGCGFGRITRLLAQVYPNAQITAVDLSPDQLANAKDYCSEYADRIEFLEYDIYSGLPLPRSNYDVSIAIEVFMHHPLEKVARLVQMLSEVTEHMVNYDWSEEWSGAVARHVWVHDFESIYSSLGLECRVLTEPQKFRGQQQKLFIASKPSADAAVFSGMSRAGTPDEARTRREGLFRGDSQPTCSARFNYAPPQLLDQLDKDSSSPTVEIMLDGAVPDDHLIRVMNRSRTFYEHDLLEQIAVSAPRGGIYVDVGAYIGNHSVYFGKFLAEHVIAIEPLASAVLVLERNLEANSVENYDVFEVALGAEFGLGRLVLPDITAKLGMTRVDIVEESNTSIRDESLVRMDTLDHVLANLTGRARKLPISFIKIDVEGSEMDVLKGAIYTLSAQRPQLAIELQSADAYSLVARFLAEFGYRQRGKFGITPTFHFVHDSQAGP